MLEEISKSMLSDYYFNPYNIFFLTGNNNGGVVDKVRVGLAGNTSDINHGLDLVDLKSHLQRISYYSHAHAPDTVIIHEIIFDDVLDIIKGVGRIFDQTEMYTRPVILIWTDNLKNAKKEWFRAGAYNCITTEVLLNSKMMERVLILARKKRIKKIWGDREEEN